ncbi:MAG: 1-phosphofructokinase [Nitrospiraceae bacterium]|nr:1-phosphofructokinase [Nitrospiraceae bacterium]
MIYTITLNPALDHFLEVEEFRVDDANRVLTETLYAGGKGIDVSRAIRQLGGESMALGFIGGHNGRVMVDLLKAEGVTCYFTPIEQETRRNVIVTTTGTRTQTVLNAKGPTIAPEEWQAFLAHLNVLDLRHAYVVMSGSLPRGVPTDAYRQIVTLVQDHGAKAVLDADGTALRFGLQAKPFATKPNVNELQRLVAKPLRNERALLQAASRLNQQGIDVVMVSRGRAGLLMVDRLEQFRAVPPKVTVRSTVGAGDSTVAGFVFMHAGGKPLEDCARFATASGTAATLAPGNQLCRLRDVQRLLSKVKVDRLDGEG